MAYNFETTKVTTEVLTTNGQPASYEFQETYDYLVGLMKRSNILGENARVNDSVARRIALALLNETHILTMKRKYVTANWRQKEQNA